MRGYSYLLYKINLPVSFKTRGAQILFRFWKWIFTRCFNGGDFMVPRGYHMTVFGLNFLYIRAKRVCFLSTVRQKNVRWALIIWLRIY